MSKNYRSILLLVLIYFIAAGVSADHHEKVTVGDLSWMTGSWAGPAGPGVTLEENWIQPTGGSIASLVRMTSSDKTAMVELIVIEEENNSLVLRVKQWDSGFKPRTPEPQTMKLKSIGKNRVEFEATGPGGMKTLGYSSPEVGKFNIDVETAEGAKFQLNLSAR